MTTRRRRTVWVVAGAHVAAVAALSIRGCGFEPDPVEVRAEDVMMVELAPARPAPPATREVESIELPPKAEPEAVPAPPPPEPEPEPEPKPEPKPKPKKREIQISTKRVVREATPPEPVLDAQALTEALEESIPSDQTPGPTLDLPAWYYSVIRKTMYDAWEQPGHLRASAGYQAVVRLRVAPGGQVSSWTLSRGSGNAAMDQSVERAMATVGQLKPLPEGFRDGPRDITVVFELSP